MSTSISWTDHTWNPITGCSKDCSYCYAKSFATRMKCHPNPKIKHQYRNGFEPTCHEERLNIPGQWKKPRRIFVNSMGDLFDPAIPFEFISRVMDVIEHHQQHTYQILTKQPERMKEFFDQHKWKFFDKTPDFVWLGVTVTNQQDADERIVTLVKTYAGKHFISAEPLLGPVDLGKEYLTLATGLERYPFKGLEDQYRTKLIDMLDWVIVGGETGHTARKMQPEWVMDIKEQCEQANTAFFFKSWGGKLKTETIDGKEYKEFPK